MKSPLFTLLAVFLFWSYTNAQETIVCEGVAQVELSKYEARADTEKKALDLAVYNALEQTFGTIIIQGTSSFLRNVQNGQDLNSESSFTMMANTQVRGELVEILDKKYEVIEGIKIVLGSETKASDLRCKVKIRARELNATPIEFTAYPIACPNKNCLKVDFQSGDDLFFYYKGERDGYLWVYLDDGNQVYCLLPYSDMPSEYKGGFPVQQETEYLFFENSNTAHAMKELDFLVDEYQLEAETPKDYNRMYVIHSQEPLNQLKSVKEAKGLLSAEDLDAGFTVPRYTTTRKFQNWLARNRVLNPGLQIKLIDITITQ